MRFTIIIVILLCQICSVSGMAKKSGNPLSEKKSNMKILSSDLFRNLKEDVSVKTYYLYKKNMAEGNLDKAKFLSKKLKRTYSNKMLKPLTISENINFLIAKDEKEEVLRYIIKINNEIGDNYPIEKLGQNLVSGFSNYKNRALIKLTLKNLINGLPALQKDINLLELYLKYCNKGGDEWNRTVIMLWQNGSIKEFNKSHQIQLEQLKKYSTKFAKNVYEHFKVQKREKNSSYIRKEVPNYLRQIDHNSPYFGRLRDLYFQMLVKKREYTKLIQILNAKSEEQRYYISETDAIIRQIGLYVKKGWIKKADQLIYRIRKKNKNTNLNKSYFLIGDFYFVRGKNEKSLEYINKMDLENISDSLLQVVQWRRFRINEKRKERLKKIIDWSDNYNFESKEVAAKFCYWGIKSNVYPGRDYISCYQRYPFTYYGIRALQNKKLYSGLKNSLIQKRKKDIADGRLTENKTKFLGILMVLYAFGEIEIADLMVKKYLKAFKDLDSFLKVTEILFVADRYYLLQSLMIPHSGKIFDRQEDSFPQLMMTSYPRAFEKHVKKHSLKTSVPKPMVYAVMREESTFRPEVVSPAGAIGLMQLMPKTAVYVGKKIRLKIKTGMLSDPSLNIKLGTEYLKRLMRQYHGNMYYTLAAYNGGGSNVKRWRKKSQTEDIDHFVEAITFIETQNYVKRVMRSFFIYERLYD